MKGKGAQLDLFSAPARQGAVLKCPVSSPFLPTLAAAILDGSIWNRGAPEPHELAQLTVYLPTNASVEPLKLAFLKLAPNGATFLPRIRVLGEADPLDLFAAFGARMPAPETALDLLEKALAIPPAFKEIERQIHLAALVANASRSLLAKRLAHEPVFTPISAASAFTVAGQIAALIGEAHAEGVDVSRITLLDESRASGSEQLSLQLLREVLRGWEAHKRKGGKLDSDDRRNRLMAIEAEFIRLSDAPIIIAGSTGSVAATVDLMKAALSRMQSVIVLYGLDNEASAVEAHPEHPQCGLQQLLGKLRIRVEDVASLPPLPKAAGSNTDERDRRARFLSAALKPAPETANWARFIEEARREARNPAPALSFIEAETVQDEAAAIALMLRESLETPGQTAALVTPSDSLLSRVRHALAQWGIGAESPATAPNADRMACRAVACAASGKPEEFAGLLRLVGQASPQIGRAAEIVDLGVLRQMWRPSTLQGIPAALSRAEHAIATGEARHPAMKRIAASEWEATRSLAAQVIEALSPLALSDKKHTSLPDWVALHREALSRLAPLGLSGAESPTVSALEQAAAPSFMLEITDYAGLFAQIASARPRNAEESAHPRLFLSKPLDARLFHADLLILAGLNEGCWPRGSGPDPWLSRRDREFVGLPPQERRIGRQAHDFFSLAASAPRAVLTRAKKENGSLTRPSRWISRVKALAAGARISVALAPERPWLDWVLAHRAPVAVTPVSRPQPKPPVSVRPRRLSVTAIETWFANPYAIYARHILGLDSLRGLDDTGDARDKGVLYHAALHSFFQAYPSELPQNIADELVRMLGKAAEELGFNLENAPFWRPRFARFAKWFAETEGGRREGVALLKSEVGGKLTVQAPAGPFEITARADRIDRLAGGGLRLYDFKTSVNTAKISAKRGAPQLALEGLLAKEGAFAGIPAGDAAELVYIIATGGQPPGDIIKPSVPAAQAIANARNGALNRIIAFDEVETAYGYERRAIFGEKAEYDPYAHLARVAEWSAETGDSEGGDD